MAITEQQLRDLQPGDRVVFRNKKTGTIISVSHRPTYFVMHLRGLVKNTTYIVSYFYADIGKKSYDKQDVVDVVAINKKPNAWQKIINLLIEHAISN